MSDAGAVALVLIVVGIALVIYLLPAIIAFRATHPNRWVILALNVFFGSTIIAWVGCLIWALHAVHRSEAGTNGGESGLNLMANDIKTMRIANANLNTTSGSNSLSVRMSPAEAIDQISRLEDLRVRNCISIEEHKRLKSEILARI